MSRQTLVKVADVAVAFEGAVDLFPPFVRGGVAQEVVDLGRRWESRPARSR